MSSTQATTARIVRVATRGSPLALYQAHAVAGLLGSLEDVAGCEIVVVQTTGDKLTSVPIEKIGGQGAFVKEVQTAVLDGRADVAVHSAKDLPSSTPPGLVLACVPQRSDPRDALVGRCLDDLPPGALVATGAPRRRAQLAWLRPDLTFCDLRGNMDRRLEHAQEVGAGVLAACALERLGLLAHIVEVLEPNVMVPQVAQGALAVECREDDIDCRRLLALVDDAVAHTEVRAERAFLAALGGGCTLPVGAFATSDLSSGALYMEGMLASRDGRVMLRSTAHETGPDGSARAEALGTRLALELLDECGGRALDDWDLAEGDVRDPVGP